MANELLRTLPMHRGCVCWRGEVFENVFESQSDKMNTYVFEMMGNIQKIVLSEKLKERK